MLDVMRRHASGWVAKILLALLIVSFGIWGIADVFRGFGSTTVAEVGRTKISGIVFEETYRRQLDQLGRQRGRPVSRDEATRAGLPGQVLSRMVDDAVLEEAARRMGLGISDMELVRQIQSDPNFQTQGRFDRNQFGRLLQSNGWSEARYVDEVRRAALRNQIVDGVAGAMPGPKVLVEAVERYRNEERAVVYLDLQPASLGAIEDPAPDVLAKFFEERKAAFKAPEYRKITALAIDPASIAKPADVTDDDARAYYQRNLARFGEPEKRRVEQIAFDKPEDAAAALAKIKTGSSFADIMAERNVKPEDADLGLLAKSGFLDPAVGDAAFKLGAVGDVSDVVKGRFRTVLLRLAEVKPAGQKPFEEVRDSIKATVARERAEGEILGVHDQIEDARAGGTKLEDIARRFGLKAVSVEVEKSGRTSAGTEVEGIPEAAKVVAAAFESDVGVENDTMQLASNGFLWFDVTGISPPRDRTLDEVKDEVTQRWKAEQTRTRLAAKAAELVARLEKGDKIEEVAASSGLEAKTATGVKRGTPVEGLSSAAVNAAFGGAEGHVATALGNGDGRIVLKVTEVAEPAFFGESETAKQVAEQISEDIRASVFAPYQRWLRNDIGVTVNQQLVARLTGNNPNAP